MICIACCEDKWKLPIVLYLVSLHSKRNSLYKVVIFSTHKHKKRILYSSPDSRNLDRKKTAEKFYLTLTNIALTFVF